ncbi:16S rRNA (guanine(527)-N(7))-methyltransferase RsmG [Flavobacterium aurantiibacter]|uniref:Ribosomal RNA small subunit methyltransferase G n=1 Tax=Flavobacterium aurantiibacter TaxID=2023067 RepID=A0A255ZV72_9FLAO|nr:16S rRNA (guanine(527)-N(7))-methyltransferase RsmG [Flavobacterium aurantiibacter]OYQ44815.1 16S rRNA (guanine(527)-N(7))-methyltransferase RsmG [Flavobacterium aurantiibacter]
MEQILAYFPDLTSSQRAQFEQLEALYTDWNAKINVISRKDIDSLYEKHVLHALSIAKVQAFLPDAHILDVGTGGGFPGIPLAILFPEVQFTLVDVIGKKIKVVEAVAAALELKNVSAKQQRAAQVQGHFDFVVSRAVTNMSDFASWVNGKFRSKSRHELRNGILYLKGGDLTEELSDFPKAKQFDIARFFHEEFFETKKVVYVPF